MPEMPYLDDRDFGDRENEDFETTPDLVLVTDPFGLFLRVSPSVKALLGYEQHELEGRLAHDFIHPLDLAETQNEMRLSRRTGKKRHFYCRYIDKSDNSVELIWSGEWLKDKAEYVFVGRPPRGRAKLPFTHRMDLLDGFQVSKGLFALTLVLAWWIGIGGNSILEVRQVFDKFDGDRDLLIAFLSLYAAASLVCLVWKQRVFQLFVSLISVVMWIWMGFVTLSSPRYVAASGIYELMLGVGSIFVLYFRGRQL